MKKVNFKEGKTKIVFIIAIVIVVIVLGLLVKNIMTNRSSNQPKSDMEILEGAIANTNVLENYQLAFSTIVTIDDGEVKQTAINQDVKVRGKGSEDLTYSVDTSTVSTDVTTGNTADEVSRYTYYNQSYYYALPGIKYSSKTTSEAAQSNIENLTNVVSFDTSQMSDVQTQNDGENTVYSFLVGYDAVSDYVKTIHKSAIDQVGEGTFSTQASATVTVNNDLVVARSIYIECENELGDSIVIEIVTELMGTTPQVEVPEVEKYPEV